MTKAIRAGIAATLSFAAIFGLLLHWKLSGHALGKVALIRSSQTLLGLFDAWNAAGSPEGEAAERFLIEHGFTKPFVFTNAVRVGGASLECVFAINDAAFANPGVLAVTREGTVIWIGKHERQIVFRGPIGTNNNH
jgi:hypothetical protein